MSGNNLYRASYVYQAYQALKNGTANVNYSDAVRLSILNQLASLLQGKDLSLELNLDNTSPEVLAYIIAFDSSYQKGRRNGYRSGAYGQGTYGQGRYGQGYRQGYRQGMYGQDYGQGMNGQVNVALTDAELAAMSLGDAAAGTGSGVILLNLQEPRLSTCAKRCGGCGHSVCRCGEKRHHKRRHHKHRSCNKCHKKRRHCECSSSSSSSSSCSSSSSSSSCSSSSSSSSSSVPCGCDRGNGYSRRWAKGRH